MLKSIATGILAALAAIFGAHQAAVAISPPQPTSAQVAAVQNAVAPPAPTGLSYQCNASGTQVTFTWDATPGATNYSPNVNTPSACPAGWYSDNGGQCNQGYGSAAGPLVTETSTVFATNPGQTYSWYLYAVNDTAVDWSNPGQGQVFACHATSPTPTPPVVAPTPAPTPSSGSGGSVPGTGSSGSPPSSPVLTSSPVPAASLKPAVAACPLIVRRLAYGSRGKDVSALQGYFASQGFLTADSITGFYGNLTRGAVTQFQIAHRFEPVGYTGPLTRKALAACNT